MMKPQFLHNFSTYVDDTAEDIRNDAEDHALLLGTSHDDVVEIWHLGHVNGNVTYRSITAGATQITVFEEAVVDIAFSPDSTAVAVASLDGYVRFFLVMNCHFMLFVFFLLNIFFHVYTGQY